MNDEGEYDHKTWDEIDPEKELKKIENISNNTDNIFKIAIFVFILIFIIIFSGTYKSNHKTHNINQLNSEELKLNDINNNEY